MFNDSSKPESEAVSTPASLSPRRAPSRRKARGTTAAVPPSGSGHRPSGPFGAAHPYVLAGLVFGDVVELKGAPFVQSYVEITPSIAAQIRNYNTRNRRLVRGTADKYAEAVRLGEWVSSPLGLVLGLLPVHASTEAGHPIAAVEPALLDGQHRIEGIIVADKSAWMTVTYYLDEPSSRRAREAIDQGKPRTVADVGALTGDLPLTGGTELVSTTNCVMLTRANRAQAGRGAGLADIKVELQKPTGASIRWAAEKLRGTRELTAPIRAAFAIAHTRDPELANDLATALADAFRPGRGRSPNEAAEALRTQHHDGKLLATNYMTRLQTTARTLAFIDAYFEQRPPPQKVHVAKVGDIAKIIAKFGAF